MKKKLLVVEDEKSLLTLFTGVLKSEKNATAYEVFDAGDYDEAVRLAGDHEFDLVLTDYHLPGKDGVTLIQDLKARNPGIACVIISGYLSPSITAQAMEAGAYVCLKKPCSIHLIRETVTEALASGGIHQTGPTQAVTASPAREDIRRLIENYPHKAFFIDSDHVIKSANSLFTAAYREQAGKRCHEVLFGTHEPCASCIRMHDDRTHVVVNENENSEIIKEQVEPWHDGGKENGYIISILSRKGESQEDEAAQFRDLKNNFYLLAIDHDGRIRYAGPALAALFTGGESIQGRSIDEFLHSYFIQLLKKEQTTFVQYALANKNRQVTLDFITRDSLERHSLLCEFRKNDGSFPDSWAVLVICMDTQMRNELYRIVEFERESLRQLRDGQFDMVITTGRMMEIKTVNKICLDKLGVKHKEIAGMSFKDLLPVRRDRYAFEQAVVQVKTLKSVFNLRMDIGYGNRRIATLVNMSAVRDPFNDEAGYVIVLHDIEGRLRMETTLQSVERMRALGQLAAGIAHQINNYTNAIAGSTELLRDSLLDVAADRPDLASESSALVKLIRDSVAKLTGLTQHLTSFARAQQPPVISPGSVNKVILDILSLVETQANKKTISLESALDDDIPFIAFSPLHLEQALLNIIMNAIDAVKPETGIVRVSTRKDDENIVIEVSDNGTGIPAQVRERLFEAFVTSKPAGIGTGLGLNIARNVVESLKGRIDVNTGDAGTTMTVCIPIKQETPSA